MRQPKRDVQLAVGASARAVKGRDDALEFVMNGSGPDRGGDWLDHSGAELDRFRANPVMPWAHEHRGLPLGHWEDVRAGKRGLVGVGVFSAREVYPFSELVLQMYLRKILRACSIGFLPLEWTWAHDRGEGARNYHKYELLECSAVMIGQHQDALAQAKAAGLSIRPALERAEAEREKHGRCLWLPKSYAHQLEGSPRSVHFPRNPTEEEARQLRKREAKAEAETVTRLVMERLAPVLSPVVDEYLAAADAEASEAAVVQQLLLEIDRERAAEAAAKRAERAAMAQALRELCAEAGAEAARTREARWRR